MILILDDVILIVSAVVVDDAWPWSMTRHLDRARGPGIVSVQGIDQVGMTRTRNTRYRPPSRARRRHRRGSIRIPSTITNMPYTGSHVRHCQEKEGFPQGPSHVLFAKR